MWRVGLYPSINPSVHHPSACSSVNYYYFRSLQAAVGDQMIKNPKSIAFWRSVNKLSLPMCTSQAYLRLKSSVWYWIGKREHYKMACCQDWDNHISWKVTWRFHIQVKRVKPISRKPINIYRSTIEPYSAYCCIFGILQVTQMANLRMLFKIARIIIGAPYFKRYSVNEQVWKMNWPQSWRSEI